MLRMANVRPGFDPVWDAFRSMHACWENDDASPEGSDDETYNKSTRSLRRFQVRNNGTVTRASGRYGSDRGPSHDRGEDDGDDWSGYRHDYLNRLAVREMFEEFDGYEPAGWSIYDYDDSSWDDYSDWGEAEPDDFLPASEPDESSDYDLSCRSCGSELLQRGGRCWDCDHGYDNSMMKRPREAFICQGCGGGLHGDDGRCQRCAFICGPYVGWQVVIAFNRQAGFDWNSVQPDVCPYTGQNLEYIPVTGLRVDTPDLSVAYSPDGRLRFAQGR